MADKSICKIDGSHKPLTRRGWCNAHYLRWRRLGDPLLGRTHNGAAALFLGEVVLRHESAECLMWPYQRDRGGYGRISGSGRSRLVSRLVCERIHGAPPTLDHEAAHSCGNGHLGCVNPKHLRWTTSRENKRDMREHGTIAVAERNGQAKLTSAGVSEIRSLRGKMTVREIARRFHISGAQVSDIQNGKYWKNAGD